MSDVIVVVVVMVVVAVDDGEVVIERGGRGILETRIVWRTSRRSVLVRAGFGKLLLQGSGDQSRRICAVVFLRSFEVVYWGAVGVPGGGGGG